MDEFELTYLAKKSIMDKLPGSQMKEMLDIYIPESADHPILRIRKNGDKKEMTKKAPAQGNDSTHQIEITIPLKDDEYEYLATLKGKRVGKNRYTYEENGTMYEVDVFTGDLAGLVLVDVEFKNREEMDAFTPPEWCGRDVSQEKFTAGGVVCGKSYSDLEEKLREFNYEKII